MFALASPTPLPMPAPPGIFSPVFYIRHAAGRVHSGRAALIALDGDLVAVAVFVVFCTVPAADASGVRAALCIFDGDIAFDGHVTDTERAAANACAIAAAGDSANRCTIFDSYRAVA